MPNKKRDEYPALWSAKHSISTVKFLDLDEGQKID